MMLEQSPPSPDTSLPNPLQSALLSSLMGGQSGGLDLQSLLAAHGGGNQTSGVDLASLLAAQGNNGELGDDRLSLILRWLEQQRVTTAQTEAVEESPSEAEVELQRLEALRQKREQKEEKRAQAQELKNVMQSLYAELETLRARNDTLAEALGACYLCFGEDLTCPECNGHGIPGSLLPDTRAFQQYVIPAVERLRSAQTKTASNTSPRTGKTYQPRGNQTA